MSHVILQFMYKSLKNNTHCTSKQPKKTAHATISVITPRLH